ncbi:hypothetical protein Q9295_05525 [Xinfangfangia sp. CPCC 101601]|uniref:Cytochrome C oxidase assembly protein n=1 Tax=Pseudogemmobacter lacusdianii TaxID=3069608 RepID=A0ABU0VVP6_9RHOB|nr:hypothetical protein [Xinfangfangia sp. CPCC 101601]MDQ2065821.1 hypothetical protein [Xinfangfangia sp. CPCC 101601]
MAIHVTHELHKRRFSRNLGLGLVLAAFVVLVFALSVVKVTRGDPMKGYDHTPSAGHLPRVDAEPAAVDSGVQP